MPANSSTLSPGILRPFWNTTIDERLTEFAAIRERPMEFHVEGHGGRGFWSATSYSDVAEISRQPEVFSSAQGFSLDDMPREVLEFMGSMIAMDDPRHRRMRRLVQNAFTPRAIRGLSDTVERIADDIVVDLRDKTDFDWVPDVATRLPLEVICDLLAIPVGDRDMLRGLVDKVVGAQDPDFGGGEAGVEAVLSLAGYASDLSEERRRDPGDDITSRLVTADVDGNALTPSEFASFMILLFAAGNDTTRTALSWSIELLSRFPDQKRALTEDFDELAPNAIEEIVRWSSPVLHMRRTLTQDAAVGGTALSAGDKVVMWYLAANHDPTVFDEPDRFDIRRHNARAHLAFGAGGPHFCLGANLARMEVRVVLKRLLESFPDIRTTGEPQLLLSPFVNAVKSLPCTVR